MSKPDELHPVNIIPAIAWALELYLKAGGKYKEGKTVELIFPVQDHREKLMKKGTHDIYMWFTKGKISLRARCDYDKKCSFNSERIDGADREAVKKLNWGEARTATFFKALRKWVIRLDLDFVTFMRALNTVCDNRVEIPMTTKYGRTFQKFDEYRRNGWPEDITPDNREEFIEEVLVRVAFWIQSAYQVGALK
jgi:hypothetical protein